MITAVLVAGIGLWFWGAFTDGRVQAYIDNNATQSWGPDAEYYMADLCETTNRFEDALHAYHKLIEVAPTNPRAELSMYRIAIDLSELHKFDEAVKAFDDFLEKYPHSDFRSLAMQKRAIILNR